MAWLHIPDYKKARNRVKKWFTKKFCYSRSRYWCNLQLPPFHYSLMKFDALLCLIINAHPFKVLPIMCLLSCCIFHKALSNKLAGDVSLTPLFQNGCLLFCFDLWYFSWTIPVFTSLNSKLNFQAFSFYTINPYNLTQFLLVKEISL